jgi:NAD(P)-dependent dehydrogenase (short-subunit alcohol dehydrogenase family)
VAARQVVLITGCSSGIGRAAALEAARRGHAVFATARNRNDLADLERGDLHTLTLDVTSGTSIRAALDAVLAKAGRLDALVNNAGYAQYGSAEDVSSEEWRAQFDVNFFGTLEVTRAALPALRESGRGTIVMISSVAGKVPVPFASPYCSAKHALEALSDALRVELYPFGVRVAVIEPGPTPTRFTERARSIVAPLLSRPGPYRSFYAGAERAMDGDFQKGGTSAEAVARVIVDAVEAEHPRARYRVGAMAKTLIPMTSILPEKWRDWMMRKSLRIPGRDSR